jgi:hypothetical protein
VQLSSSGNEPAAACPCSTLLTQAPGPITPPAYRDLAESGSNHVREAPTGEAAVGYGVDRLDWARSRAVAGYLVTVALIVWGIASSDPAPILLGLVLLAVLLLTTNG